MATYRHQFTIHTVDAIPKNFVTNTLFSFAANDAEAQLNVDDFVVMFRAFSGLYSSYVAQNNHDVKTYDMADPEPRVAHLATTWNFSSVPSGGPLPPELAICLSFQAVKASGLSQARRRGRIYLGPINVTQNDTGGRPHTSARTTIATAALACKNAIIANGPGTRWAVWSQIDHLGSAINDGWIDNDWDVQRRRELGPTQRTVW